MASSGAKPKPDGQKVTRVPLTTEWRDVEAVPFEGAPKLPRHPAGLPWPTWTKRWWAVVAKMPHCVLWEDDDWQYAFETAIVAAEFHGGDMRQAKELRDRERKMAMTQDDRRDQRIRYVEPSSEPQREDASDTVADFESERRRRLKESE